MSCPGCGGPYTSRHQLDYCPACFKAAEDKASKLYEPSKKVVPLAVFPGGKDSSEEKSLDKILRNALENSGSFRHGILVMCDDGGRIAVLRTRPMTAFIGFGLVKVVEMDIAGELVAANRKG